MSAFNPHEYLDSFVNFESQLHKLRPEDFNLGRIQRFLDLAGNPAKNLKIIHVAGTKGKGSTCAFLAGILQEAGYTVGLYTSPHLHRVNERIRILNTDNIRSTDNFSGAISDEDLGAVLADLRPLAAAIQNEGSLLTFFEVLTVAALCYFAKSQVDIVILETGLGGRLDATNAVDSLVAVITPVSLDHTRILGSNLSQIAVEKAGIIKNGRQKVVVAPQEKEVMGIVLDRCRAFAIEPIVVSVDKYKDLKPALKGKHQIVNAATALEVAALLKDAGFKISKDNAKQGLQHVRWPGRFELLRKNPDIIIDCAHNAASAQALAQTVAQEYPSRRVLLVMGISEDKDAQAMSAHLKKSAAHIFLTRAQHPRAHVFTRTEAEDYFGGKPFEITESLPKALEKALQMADPEDVILVTGSIFLVAEARDYLSNTARG